MQNNHMTIFDKGPNPDENHNDPVKRFTSNFNPCYNRIQVPPDIQYPPNQPVHMNHTMKRNNSDGVIYNYSNHFQVSNGLTTVSRPFYIPSLKVVTVNDHPYDPSLGVRRGQIPKKKKKKIQETDRRLDFQCRMKQHQDTGIGISVDSYKHFCFCKPCNKSHDETELIHLTIIDKIGQGRYGDVYKVKMDHSKPNNLSNQYYALKGVCDSQAVINFPRTDNASHRPELQVLQSLKDHPNIIKLYNYFLVRTLFIGSHDRPLYWYGFITELFDHNLFDKIYQTVCEPKDMSSRADHIRVKEDRISALNGLDYMHSKHIVHCDLKPENIGLICGQNGIIMAKIMDLGNSRSIDTRDENNPDVCTMIYSAPELLLKFHDWRATIDVWSLGCVMLETLVGRPFLYQTSNESMMRSIRILLHDVPADKHLINLDIGQRNYICTGRNCTFVKKSKKINLKITTTYKQDYIDIQNPTNSSTYILLKKYLKTVGKNKYNHDDQLSKDFLEVLKRIFQYSDKRINSTQLLKMNFFKNANRMVSSKPSFSIRSNARQIHSSSEDTSFDCRERTAIQALVMTDNSTPSVVSEDLKRSSLFMRKTKKRKRPAIQELAMTDSKHVYSSTSEYPNSTSSNVSEDLNPSDCITLKHKKIMTSKNSEDPSPSDSNGDPKLQDCIMRKTRKRPAIQALAMADSTPIYSSTTEYPNSTSSIVSEDLEDHEEN